MLDVCFQTVGVNQDKHAQVALIVTVNATFTHASRSQSSMGSVFPPPLKKIAAEVADILKTRKLTLSVAETVSPYPQYRRLTSVHGAYPDDHHVLIGLRWFDIRIPAFNCGSQCFLQGWPYALYA